jgi:hypothetical protein
MDGFGPSFAQFFRIPSISDADRLDVSGTRALSGADRRC